MATDEEVFRVAHAIAMCSEDSFIAYAEAAISEMRAIEREKAPRYYTHILDEQDKGWIADSPTGT